VNAVPHRFNPFAAEDAKDNHERVKEVAKMPPQLAPVEVLGDVVGSEQLHTHDGEDEDDDGEDETEIAERSHRSADDTDE